MTIIKELSVVVRTYEKNGETKKVWKNIGAIHEGQHGQYMVLDSLVNLAAIPRRDGDDRVYVSMFDPKKRQDKQEADMPSDDIEF